MNFLPTENITYKSKLKNEDLLSRLAAAIEPEKTFRFPAFSSGSTKPYEGQINGQTFEIKRIIRYRNSFLPRITGTIESHPYGTTIHVKMRLHIFVITFLFFWCGMVGIGSIAIAKHYFEGAAFNAIALIPFGILLLVYTLTMGAFTFESNRSKKDLQQIFEAGILESAS